jgi:hypothetical protein
MGPLAVPAWKEEAVVLHEALLSGAWHRHCAGSAALIAIDRCSRTTRRLGGRRQAKGCDGQLTEA